MDALTSMITTVITMRQNLRVLYNVLHQTRTGKLRTEILLMTTYNHIDQIQKDLALFKPFGTDMN